MTSITAGRLVVTALGVTSGQPALGLVLRSVGVVVGAGPTSRCCGRGIYNNANCTPCMW